MPRKLLAMKLSSLTLEKAAALRAQSACAEEELAALRATLPETLWRRDLDALEAELCGARPPSSKRARKEG